MNRHMYARAQEQSYLAHHGIKGQKWGIRRYQNEDGTLTEEGKKRYGYDETTGRMTEKGMGRRYGDAMKTVGRQYETEGRELWNELSIAAKRDEAQYFNMGDDNPKNMHKVLSEYQDRIRKAYGGEVSDEEIQYAAATYARGQAKTSMVLGIIGGSFTMGSAGIAAWANAKRGTNDGGLYAASAALAGVGAMPIVVGAANYGGANKEYKRAKKAYQERNEKV